MKKILVMTFLILCISLVGCGNKKEPEIVEEEWEYIPLTNDKPIREEKVGEEIWVTCPKTSTRVGSSYTFTDGKNTYYTDNAKIGEALMFGLKYESFSAEIQVKARTVVNPDKFDIVKCKFYDNGTELRKSTVDELIEYYKKEYNLATPGDVFSATLQLNGVKKEKTLNGQEYLALTFTDENFENIIVRDYNKQDLMVLNESYCGNWYTISYRVDEGLYYHDNKTDIYYTLTSMKEY